MNIVSTQYTLEYKALEIYISGCSGNPKCEGCHNPDLWNFNLGEDYLDAIDSILKKVYEFDKLIDNIFVMGGEPLDNELLSLINLLNKLSLTKKNIWLFTRYDFDSISPKVIEQCNYIKCGKYIPDLRVDDNIQYGIKLATSNQKIYKVKRGV